MQQGKYFILPPFKQISLCLNMFYSFTPLYNPTFHTILFYCIPYCQNITKKQIILNNDNTISTLYKYCRYQVFPGFHTLHFT